MYVNSYGNICKNKGSQTLGIPQDEAYIETFSYEKAMKIAQEIQSQKYNWSPTRRTMIPKPGKKKLRPIDTPTQKDRIVQEAIRSILETIYEPEFQDFEKRSNGLSTNFGFRPQKCAYMALKSLKDHGKLTNLGIEGDIVGAYNNVDHDKLMGILSIRIKDKKFLNIVRNLLKSGVMSQGLTLHSLKGTPQGGIVSPLLFNIYMFQLDQFIYEDIRSRLESNSTKKFIQSKEYGNQKRKIERLEKFIRSLPKESKERAQKVKELKRERATLFTIPYSDIRCKPVGAVYARYADDWVYLITGNKKDALTLKEKISKFITTELKMELDSEKTKITKLKDGINFLGYELRMWKSNQDKIKNVKQNNKRVFKMRTTSRRINILPSLSRLRENLITKGYLDRKSNRGKSVRFMLDKSPFYIAKRFESVSTGIINYYKFVDDPSRLHFVLYTLQYSCLNTIAAREKSTLRKVIRKVGVNSKIGNTRINSKGKRVLNYSYMPSLKQVRDRFTQYKGRPTSDWDPFKIHVNRRSKERFTAICSVCGVTTFHMEMHHIKPLKLSNSLKYNFTHPLTQRKQIPVCPKCHQNITNGNYVGISLRKLNSE